ncbi:CAF17-like 4Fe-4S cluster assembly/insertion protein YgfZ [Planosporangium mesophilum]|uniref:Glycine cleavage system protein T n=1 Tax=Planosporangium mesophilum TaxID=689768 RepID=A0A8J3T9Z8_9ACTN|nr:folate-binding protein YgfZ [Planosporangium mesophilum]NJC80986.1 folate-binding protein YgfZ [Planosporangium mesophilum]GII21372.1 glycine cleavage system protein T [Planosporangium mesophilum]
MITASGAVPVAALDPESPDAGVVAHYGDPMREQRTLATSVGLVDRSHRGVIAVPGEDRLSWLHSLTTQYLTDLPAMTGTEMLVLSPHGHVEHHAGVADDGATTWLDVEPGRAGALLDFLTRMRFLMRVEPADVSADYSLLSLVGPDTDQALVALGVGPLLPPDAVPVPGAKFATGSVPSRPTTLYSVGALPDLGGWARRMPYGADLLVPRGAEADLVAAAGVPLAGLWAFEALRVADRRPRFGLETDHRTLPAEVGWTAPAVHLEKGCYRGQETIARVHHLGRPPRRLVLLHLDGITTEELPAHGTAVTTAEGRQVGFVGTAARHFEYGMIALAVVKQNVADAAELRIGEAAAAIDPGE